MYEFCFESLTEERERGVAQDSGTREEKEEWEEAKDFGITTYTINSPDSTATIRSTTMVNHQTTEIHGLVQYL